jgi:hypothetical protein
VRETLGPAKPKIFTIKPITENICQTLLKSSIFVKVHNMGYCNHECLYITPSFTGYLMTVIKVIKHLKMNYIFLIYANTLVSKLLFFLMTSNFSDLEDTLGGKTPQFNLSFQSKGDFWNNE